jgi:hypothetical protein
MFTNCLARAKLVKNAKLKTVRLIVAFNVNPSVNNAGDIVYLFPTQSKCAYVSGDLAAEDVLDTVAKAQQTLRTNNIQFV